MILQTARRFRLAGTYDRDSLGILRPIAEHQDVSEMLQARYIDPVFQASTMGDEILTTVEAYLDRHSIPLTAARLSIHVNTARYRLEKFTELTGCKLESAKESTEVWWALQARRLNR